MYAWALTYLLKIPALLAKAPIIYWVCMVLGLWGWYGNNQAADLKQRIKDSDIAALKEESRLIAKVNELERVNADHVIKISGLLAQGQVTRVGDRSVVSERLHNLAKTKSIVTLPEAARTTCRYDDLPAVSIIPFETRRDLISLADDAQAVSVRLSACQTYVKQVK